jgi:hypothetical protein
MIGVDRLLFKSLRFLLERVGETVAAERDAVDAMREELLADEMALERGEIDEAEFERREAAMVGRLRDIEDRYEGAMAFAGEPEDVPPAERSQTVGRVPTPRRQRPRHKSGKRRRL